MKLKNSLLFVLFASLCSFPLVAFAHEKWFTENVDGIVRPELLSSWNAVTISVTLLSFAAFVVAIATQFVLRQTSLASWWDTVIIRRFRPFEPWTATLLGVLSGVVLVGLSLQNALVAVNFSVDSFPRWIELLLLTVQAVIGISFIAGLFVRVTSALFVFLFLGAMVLFSPLDVLDNVLLLGIALYLFVNGRGVLALDEQIWAPGGLWLKKNINLPFSSVNALRIIAGLNFLYLGTHKIVFPELDLALLYHYPFLNFMPILGFHPFSDNMFVLCAAAVEITVSILLIFGTFTRFLTIILFMIFSATMFVFGPAELLGHLPHFGLFFLLFIFGNQSKMKIYT